MISLLLAALLGCPLAGPPAGPTARPEDSPPGADTPPPPNVLFLISDDLGAQALGCYGNDQCRTPHIDGLARRSVRFTRAFCQFPICGPSRAALMSGLYPHSLGILGNGGAERFAESLGERPSLGQCFRGGGYRVTRIGKLYHMRIPGDLTNEVSGPDHAASWTEAFDCHGPEWRSSGTHRHLSHETLQRGEDLHYGLGFGTAFYVVRGDTDGAEQPDVKAADKAVEILRAPRDQPFFLAVGFVRPHVPLVAPARYHEAYPAEAMTLPPSVADDWADIPEAGISKNGPGSGLDAEPGRRQEVLSAYYAAVQFMDDQVGRILAALEETGQAANTVVVFTSDHGYHLGEHDLWQKMSLHEESSRIPLLISAPGHEAAVTRALAQQIDLYPTLAELCGLPIPSHCEGRSLLPALTDPEARVHREVHCARGKDQHLLRTERWAYLRYADGSRELYDMELDPRQFTNLAGSTEHEDTMAELDARLEAKRAEMQR